MVLNFGDVVKKNQSSWMTSIHLSINLGVNFCFKKIYCSTVHPHLREFLHCVSFQLGFGWQRAPI